METLGKIQGAVSGVSKPTPDTVDVSEVYRQLTSEGRVSKVMNTRFGDQMFPIRFMVLTLREIQKARGECVLHFKKQGVTPDEDMLNARLMAELLAVSCKEPSESKVNASGKTFYRPIFADADQVEGLTDDTVVALFHQYVIVKTEYAIPDESTVHTQEDLEAWVSAMAREANASFLAHLPLSQLARLGHMMAMEIRRLQNFPQSAWRNITELRQIVWGTSITSFGEQSSDGTETETQSLSMQARRNSSPKRRKGAEKEAARRKTQELLKKAAKG